MVIGVLCRGDVYSRALLQKPPTRVLEAAGMFT